MNAIIEIAGLMDHIDLTRN